MAGYAKLFSDIVDSSMWDQPPAMCKVWITMLALANQDGWLRGSVGWLARKAQVDPEECKKALDYFSTPDASSRTEAFEGRRVEQLDDGWLILNYVDYRNRLSDNPKTIATRERVQKHRDSRKALQNVT